MGHLPTPHFSLERSTIHDGSQIRHHKQASNQFIIKTKYFIPPVYRAQEKLFNLDSKLSTIANLDYKLDNLLKKLQEIEETLNVIPKKIEDKRQGEILFGEFATRGILSTLKLIERKLDKVHLTGQNLMLKQNKNDEYKGRLVKCSNPAGVEELLRDISSKVDVIFDKISEKDEVPENDNDDYFDDQQIGSGDVSDELKSDSDVRLLRKLVKRVNLPCKLTSRVLDGILTHVRDIENNTAVIVKRNGRNCKGNLDVDKLGNNFTQLSNDLQVSLNSHFSEQRAHFNTILKSNLIQNCLSPKRYPSTTPVAIVIDEDPHTDSPTTDRISIPIIPYEIEHAENVTSCDELPFDAKSGVYNFTDAKDFKLRYCREHWTIIQRRDNFADLQNFTLPWIEYKFGFGDVDRDFWIGNEFIYDMSNRKNLMLRVELEDFEGNTAWAQYSFFKLASERDNYKLFVGGYSGNASDALSSHSNSSFSTYDMKNDAAPSCCPCSLSYGGGWWFNR